MKIGTMSRQELLDKYGIESTWSTTMSMDGKELYSGDESDPLVIVQNEAENHGLILDRFGRKQPYVLTLSLFGMELERGESQWEMTHRQKMRRQMINVEVVIFKDQKSRDYYVAEELTLTTYFKDEWE